MLFRYELLGLAYFPNRLSVLAEMQVLRAWFKYAESSPLFLAKGLEGMMNEEIKSNNNERIEDVIEHDLQITRNKSKEYLKMRNSDTNSDEMAKVINSAKDVMIKAAAQKAADEGKTVEQVKQIEKAKPVDDDLESPESLRREEKRLETTIERLNDRLIQVQETLRSMTGGD